MGSIKISIAGDLGSGKSTIAQLIAKKMKCKQYSTGSIQREIAKNMNMSTLDLNEYMKTHPDIDSQIDEFNKSLNESNESFVIDSRMAWFFIPNSFKIFLQVNTDIAANRVYIDKSRESEIYHGIEAAKNDLISRKEIEYYRFQTLYNVDCSDIKNYDIVIDTSFSTPETFAVHIINLFNSWSKGKNIHKIWLSPKLLYPTQPISKLGRNSSKQIGDSIKTNGYNFDYPIEAIYSQGLYFIFNGHSRVSGSIFSGINLIPVTLITGDSENKIFGIPTSEFIKSEFKLVYAYDWEECHQIQFPSYPTDLEKCMERGTS